MIEEERACECNEELLQLFNEAAANLSLTGRGEREALLAAFVSNEVASTSEYES